MSDNSVYGVHRFYFTNKNDNAEDTAQILSAHIVKYLIEHDIKQDFFVGMSQAGPDEISILSVADLEILGVVNNGFENEKWNIKSLDSISRLYLVGERNTYFGINKFIIWCLSGKTMYLHIIFDPQGRQDQVIHMNAQSLVVDYQNFRFAEFATMKPNIINGWLNATYLIPNYLLDKIALAKTLGFVFQHSYEAPTFLGFTGLKFDEGRELFSGLRESCMN